MPEQQHDEQLTPPEADAAREADRVDDEEEPGAPGTVALVLIFLAAFAVYFFANWLALSDVWHVR